MNRKLIIALTAACLAIFVSAVFLINLNKGRSAAVGNPVVKASVNNLLTKAKELEESGQLQEAKEIYQSLISEHAGSQDVLQWQKKAEGLTIKLLFSPTITAKSELYTIKPGDTLINIAKSHGTTVDLIMKSNNLKDDKIFPGRQLKVWDAPFNILVDKSQNTLILKSGEDIIKTYTVSTGKDNSTPTGDFKIINKLKNPTWFKAGAVVPPDSPENILGTRWLGLDATGYGIHGTTEPEQLGKQVTQGCVRMANSDVEELYTIVPAGTEVIIVD